MTKKEQEARKKAEEALRRAWVALDGLYVFREGEDLRRLPEVLMPFCPTIVAVRRALEEAFKALGVPVYAAQLPGKKEDED